MERWLNSHSSLIFKIMQVLAFGLALVSCAPPAAKDPKLATVSATAEPSLENTQPQPQPQPTPPTGSLNSDENYTFQFTLEDRIPYSPSYQRYAIKNHNLLFYGTNGQYVGGLGISDPGQYGRTSPYLGSFTRTFNLDCPDSGLCTFTAKLIGPTPPAGSGDSDHNDMALTRVQILNSQGTYVDIYTANDADIAGQQSVHEITIPISFAPASL
ncbi:MAG: hypothetical protein HY390_03220 [Deltaproteobacteria bacterium]|nr:hypothetical protein [Deltaproteobacteria bacterium]